jgi:hypothetical protein
MECVGFDGFDPLGGSYNVTNQTHPLFTGPFNLHLSAGDTLGLAQGQNMSGGCVNHEYDITAHSLPIPVAPLACGSNPTPAPDVLANCGLSGGAFDFFINADNPPTVVSEISYWARPAGGTIFTVGAIAAGQGLAFDPKMLMLLMNVLSTFSVKRKEVSVSSIAFSSTQNNVVAIQKDGTMLNKWFDGSNWNPSGTGWQSLGNPALRVYFQGMPFITHNSHRINILALGTDRHIYNSYSSGAAWSSWQDLGGDFLISGDPSSPQTSDVILHPGIAISPVMVYFGNDEAWVFAIGIDGVLYGRYWNGSVWSSHTDTPLPSIINWYNLGGAFFSHPVAAMYAGMITVIAIRNDGILASRYWDGVAWHNSWTNEVVPDVQFLGSPAAIVSNPPGTSWLNVAMTALDGHIYFIRKNGNYWDAGVQDLGGNFDLSPAIIWSQNRLNIMVIGKDGHLYNKWSYDGTTWSTGWQDLGGTFRGVPSIEESLPDQIEIFVVGTDNAVYHKKWDGTQWIPSGTNWDNFGGTTGN